MQIDLSNGSIHAQVRGHGTPVVIMHGGGLDHRHMLDALEPVFTDAQGWQRIYIDLPSHGLSTVNADVRCQQDVLNMISDFVQQALKGQRCALIGESRGSYHAMGLAHIRPDDFLGMMMIVADAMPGSTRDWRPEHQTLVSVPNGATQDASPAAIARYKRLVVQRPDILEKIERSKLVAMDLVDQDLAARIQGNFDFAFDLSKPISIFDEPCLIVNGRQDAMAGYQDMLDRVEHYPRATLAVLDCAGHSLAWERPEVFKALTLDWLERMRVAKSHQ